VLFRSFFVFLGFAEAVAQQAPVSEPTYQLTGRVVEKESGEPIAYAAAVLLEAGTGKNITGGVADDNGEFFLAGFKEGKYTLQVSFMGYTPLEKDNIIIAAGKTSYNLEELFLEEESVALEEVTVQGQRDLIEEKVDRTIY